MKTARLEEWRETQRRYRLSDKHINMAIELNLNPRKLGKLVPNRSQAWKRPLPEFIEEIYFRQFKRPAPKKIVSLGAWEANLKAAKARKKETRKLKKLERTY
jgi:hypothetical protein